MERKAHVVEEGDEARVERLVGAHHVLLLAAELTSAARLGLRVPSCAASSRSGATRAIPTRRRVCAQEQRAAEHVHTCDGAAAADLVVGAVDGVGETHGHVHGEDLIVGTAGETALADEAVTLLLEVEHQLAEADVCLAVHRAPVDVVAVRVVAQEEHGRVRQRAQVHEVAQLVLHHALVEERAEAPLAERCVRAHRIASHHTTPLV